MDQNADGCISMWTRMVHLFQAGVGTKAAVFPRWLLAVQRVVSLTQSPGRAVEIQGWDTNELSSGTE